MEKKQDSSPEFEIKFYENVLKHSPNFIEALVCLGDLYTSEGFYERGLRIDERLSALRPGDPTVHYNLSCSHSLMNDIERADYYMRRAIELGYDDFAFLAQDPDLVNLLGHEEFQRFFKDIQQNSSEEVQSA